MRSSDRLVDREFTREQVGKHVDYLLEGEPQGTTESATTVHLTGESGILPQGDVIPAELNEVADRL